ncbi:MAG: hypothetical protein II674_07875 [Prevotella sp.]|nr:hypothetical protein [Prevotella sp.]MBR7054310.1 hypothetical protein [Prevotella sp.]
MTEVYGDNDFLARDGPRCGRGIVMKKALEVLFNNIRKKNAEKFVRLKQSAYLCSRIDKNKRK